VEPFPFPNSCAFQEGMKFLDVNDIGCAARVCRSWNKLIQSPSIWENLFEKEGIPRVVSLNDERRDYREDFKTLYPITISGRVISQLFGEIVGQIPPISEKWFNKLHEKDPFSKTKLIGETFFFIVVPSLITRTVDQETPLILDDSGNLIELPKQENKHSNSTETSTVERRELTFPLSLKNLNVICSYPLRGKENMPVFAKDHPLFQPLGAEILNQCSTHPDKIGVYFMRKQVAKQTKWEFYANQKKLVEFKGFKVTPLKERALFDAVNILKSGTCPDKLVYKRGTIYVHNCVRNSDTVFCHNRAYQSSIGGFNRGVRGLVIDISDDNAVSNTYVVPGISAAIDT
jgi:hypothetical protein